MVTSYYITTSKNTDKRLHSVLYILFRRDKKIFKFKIKEKKNDHPGTRNTPSNISNLRKIPANWLGANTHKITLTLIATSIVEFTLLARVLLILPTIWTIEQQQRSNRIKEIQTYSYAHSFFKKKKNLNGDSSIFFCAFLIQTFWVRIAGDMLPLNESKHENGMVNSSCGMLSWGT